MELPLFPLRTVLFPGMELPLRIFEPRYKQMLRDILGNGGTRQFGVVLIREGGEVGGGAIPHDSGTIAVIEDLQQLPNGQVMVSARGRQRFGVQRMLAPRPYPLADVRLFDPDRLGAPPAAIEEVAANVRALFPQYFQLAMSLTGQWARGLTLPSGPHELVDFIGPSLQVPEEAKQLLLDDEAAIDRLRILGAILDELVAAVREQAEEHRRRTYGALGADN